MKLLGIVEGVNPRGEIIVKSEGSTAPAIGTSIFNKSQSPIGVVRRVFGPVKNPYINVKANAQEEIETGDEVYIK